MKIDLSDRYDTPQYQRAGTDWSVDRVDEPVVALMIHHTAGWYGPKLGVVADQAFEEAQLDALAADHFNRFGIGPGYYYAAFPSGRLYVVGKYGTHRAHTRGRNPETQNWWNREALAIVAFGNYEVDPVPPTLWTAIEEGIDDVRSYTSDDIALYPHGGVPGNPTSTSCPGKHLKARLLKYMDGGAEQAWVLSGLRDAQAEIVRAIRYIEES